MISGVFFMFNNIISLVIIFSVIFLIIFLVFKSDCVTISKEDLDKLFCEENNPKIKIYIKRRGCTWNGKSSKAK